MTSSTAKRIIITRRWRSPCGVLELGSLGGRLVMSDWVDGWHRRATLSRTERLLNATFEEGDSTLLDKAQTELEEYFAGRRLTFSVPTLAAGSDFQKRVWEALQAIPWGSLVTYSELAAKLGSPRAVRAVANAVGANPLSIIIPCHRVIGADGTLAGYGGGYAAKRALLALEFGIPEQELPWPDGGTDRESR